MALIRLIEGGDPLYLANFSVSSPLSSQLPEGPSWSCGYGEAIDDGSRLPMKLFLGRPLHRVDQAQRSERR